MASLIPLDYDTLRLIWWALLGLLLIGFAVMDGFDLGVAMLLPLAGRSDAERRVVINTVGPVWEGNQVWLITGGGAVFAAWPLLYAAAFSALYLAMMLLLLAMILRPVGFKYRSKITDARWRHTWDGILAGSGLVMALVFGVAMGNLLVGIPFGVDALTMRPSHGGGFFSLFTPFPLLCGLVSVLMCAMHGGAFLAWRTDGAVAARARRWAIGAALLTAALFALGGVWVQALPGYSIVELASTTAPSNPALKQVAVEAGGWMANFERHAWMWAGPALGVAGALLAALALAARRLTAAFLSSCLSVAGIVATPGFALFPFLLPSSTQPNFSLTVWDASASVFSLWIMLLATCVFLPLIVGYTGYVYRVMRGTVSDDAVQRSHNAY